ncbi:hypothetical protein FKM82_021234 [Ascaphus truei]
MSHNPILISITLYCRFLPQYTVNERSPYMSECHMLGYCHPSKCPVTSQCCLSPCVLSPSPVSFHLSKLLVTLCQRSVSCHPVCVTSQCPVTLSVSPVTLQGFVSPITVQSVTLRKALATVTKTHCHLSPSIGSDSQVTLPILCRPVPGHSLSGGMFCCSLRPRPAWVSAA